MQGPIAVFSDLHFGDMDALLGVRGDPKHDAAALRRIESLRQWLGARAPLGAMVLLGDIWDLWQSSFQDARREGTPALHALTGVPCERIIYLPGNHDHHLLVQHQLLDQIVAMNDDDRDFGPLAITQRDYTQSYLAPLFAPEARDRLLVTYPDYMMEYAGRRLVFHHGHHTTILREGRGIFSFVPRIILHRLEGVPMAQITRSDVELASQIFFEMMYAVSQGARTRQRLNSAWDRYLNLTRRFGGGWRGLLRRLRLISSESIRGTSAFDVYSFRHPVERMLQLAAAEHDGDYPCDIYIFGHTHRAGVVTHEETLVGDVVVVNSGGWLYEPTKDNRQNEGTFLLIEPSQLGLYFQAPDGTITLRAALPL
jgi:UDP-2,3-diacylglucosamine pyrophosphatase LpxH